MNEANVITLYSFRDKTVADLELRGGVTRFVLLALPASGIFFLFPK